MHPLKLRGCKLTGVQTIGAMIIGKRNQFMQYTAAGVLTRKMDTLGDASVTYYVQAPFFNQLI